MTHESLLQTLCNEGQLDKALDSLFHICAPLSDSIYISFLKACNKSKAPIHAKRVQSHLTLYKPHLSSFLGGYLVLTLAKCGAIAEAQKISNLLPCRSVFTWTSLICAYAECGLGQEALRMHECMLEDEVKPNGYTYVSLFKACGTIPDLVKGRELHELADREGLIASNVHVGTALLSMYEKCGAVEEVEEVFAGLSERNVVSWNVMLSAYVEQGQGEKALHLYRQMQIDGLKPDDRTLLFVVQACYILSSYFIAEDVEGKLSRAMCLEIGRALHSEARAKGFTTDMFVGTALLKMYGTCGAIVEAENVFHALPHTDIVFWTAMIETYVGQGQGEQALGLYMHMQALCVTLDDVTLMCILQACNDRGCLEVCKRLHFDISSAGCDDNSSVAATLIHAYGNCASMVDAQTVFDRHPEPDIVAWNACIAGYAGHGDTAASLQLFEKLKRAGTAPDDVTFLVILLACSHAGLVFKGLELFESMTDKYGLSPGLKHYGIMVDLLGHGGHFKRLESMLDTMPMEADLTIWLCLLDACCAHGNVELARHAFDNAVNLQPKNASAYLLMSGLYVDAGLYSLAAQIGSLKLLVG